MFKLKTVHRPDANLKPILSVSKNQLKKVKNHGYFDGKNIKHFDEDLNPMSDEQFRRRRYQIQPQGDRLNSMRMKLEQHE